MIQDGVRAAIIAKLTARDGNVTFLWQLAQGVVNHLDGRHIVSDINNFPCTNDLLSLIHI